jgi:hypothetical protein
MNRPIALSLLLIVAAISLWATGLQNTAPGLEIQKVKDNLYMITTPMFGAGNTAAFITEGGVVLVDTKTPGQRPGDSRQGEKRYGEAHYDDHQYAFTRRSHGQQ